MLKGAYSYLDSGKTQAFTLWMASKTSYACDTESGMLFGYMLHCSSLFE